MMQGSSNRDFSPKWHLICVAAVATLLMLAYIVAKKLIFG
jgi:hypothetical protein